MEFGTSGGLLAAKATVLWRKGVTEEETTFDLL